MPTGEFWSGRRILVTGHTGFKGGWLGVYLHRLGAEVWGFSDDVPTHPSFFNSVNVGEYIAEDLRGDVRNYTAVESAVDASKPEIVFHLAAQPLVRASHARPRETFDTNVMGTVNVLEACRKRGSVGAIVVVTTDKCYENREWVWPYREVDRIGGKDPYSASKAAAELVTASYRSAFFQDVPGEGVGVATVRAGNVIGGGDWAEDRLVPDLIRAWSARDELVLRHPDAVRPWQHVLDPLTGYLLLAERLFRDRRDYSEGWNFAPADDAPHTVESLVREASGIWRGDASWSVRNTEASREHKELRLDASKARRRLGWRPCLSLPEAMALTVEWYDAHRSGDDVGRVTRQQFSEYEKKLTGEGT